MLPVAEDVGDRGFMVEVEVKLKLKLFPLPLQPQMDVVQLEARD